jgi:hypothetical protein
MSLKAELPSEQGQSWRDLLPIHPAAELFPRMSPDELKALGADIKNNGQHVPVTVWKEQKHLPPKLLDGISRLDAREAVGFAIEVENVGIDTDPAIRLWERQSPKHMRTPIDTVEVRGDRPGGDPYAYVIGANIHRRHLTAEQKRELIAKLIKTTPEKSDRQIAQTVKASPTTVGTVRAKMEAKGEVSKLDTRTDAKGVKQPVARARTERRERVAKLNRLESAASAKERDIRKRHDQWEEWDKKATAEAGRLANGLLILDRDLALTLNRFLHEGGESRFMEALDDALRAIDDKPSEGNGVDPAASVETMKASAAGRPAMSFR